jgi:hypothetical protein
MKLRTIFAVLPLVLVAACGDNAKNAPSDASVDGPPPCFNNPQTYNEIINACTNAQAIFKDSHPPLLNADGSLPPLPPKQ